MSAKFRKTFDRNSITCMLKNQDPVDPDEMAHPHLDLQCLQIQLLLCLALYGLTKVCTTYDSMKN